MKYKFKTKPYDHQLNALDKSWNKKTFAYFMEMGTGKSKVLVDNMAILYDKGKINGALIIAPKGVYRNWYSQEIPIHLASHIDHKTVLWTATTSKAKDKEYQQLLKIDLVLFADGVFIVVDSSTAIKVLWQLRNFMANSRPFFVENASTFIIRM